MAVYPALHGEQLKLYEESLQIENELCHYSLDVPSRVTAFASLLRTDYTLEYMLQMCSFFDKFKQEISTRLVKSFEEQMRKRILNTNYRGRDLQDTDKTWNKFYHLYDSYASSPFLSLTLDCHILADDDHRFHFFGANHVLYVKQLVGITLLPDAQVQVVKNHATLSFRESPFDIDSLKYYISKQYLGLPESFTIQLYHVSPSEASNDIRSFWDDDCTLRVRITDPLSKPTIDSCSLLVFVD